MAILESVDATYALGPTIGVDRLGALVLVVAMTHRRRVVPVHRAYVITVGAILQLELPIAVVGARKLVESDEVYWCRHQASRCREGAGHHFRGLSDGRARSAMER